MRKIILMLFLCLFLASCQRPVGQVIAEIENEKIMFHIRYPGLFFDKLFGWDDSNHSINSLYVIGNKKIIWAFDMKTEISATYPISYGQKIISSDVRVAPQKLQTNIDYKILVLEYYRQSFDNQLIDIDNINYDAIGLFRLNSDGTVINLKPD